MSIPKKIHFGIFGPWKAGLLMARCIASWKEHLPDYEIFYWNDGNAPKCQFSNNPILLSNYLKYRALFDHGGWYFDNDVEVLRPLDCTPHAAIAFQRDDTERDCINTAVLGAEAGNPFIGRCLERMNADNEHACPIWCGCGLPTEELRKVGLQGLNVEQVVGGVTVYSKERFYPWRWDEKPDATRVTGRTFAIHHWEGSWKK